MSYVVRTASVPPGLTAAARAAIAEVDPHLAGPRLGIRELGQSQPVRVSELL